MLRIMTLNLNYRMTKHGAWADRRPLIARAIEQGRADVVALQAVEGTDSGNQADELARLLDFPHVAFVATSSDRPVRRGSAFIARRALADLAVCPLTRRPGHDDPSERAVLRARPAGAAGGFDIYNAHFSWVPSQALDNARETLEFSAAAALLLGDLNSPPESAALDTFRRAGWADLWAERRPQDPGYTFEADNPTQRIDYALATEEVRARVSCITCVRADGDGPPRLSDHLGLLVTLQEVPSERR